MRQVGRVAHRHKLNELLKALAQWKLYRIKDAVDPIIDENKFMKWKIISRKPRTLQKRTKEVFRKII